MTPELETTDQHRAMVKKTVGEVAMEEYNGQIHSFAAVMIGRDGSIRFRFSMDENQRILLVGALELLAHDLICSAPRGPVQEG